MGSPLHSLVAEGQIGSLGSVTPFPSGLRNICTPPSAAEFSALPRQNQGYASVDASNVNVDACSALVESICERAQGLSSLVVNRTLFDNEVHSIETDLHQLLRHLSCTPNSWTLLEQQRLQTHIGELFKAAALLRTAFNVCRSTPVDETESFQERLREVVVNLGVAEGAVEHLHEHVERFECHGGREILWMIL